MAPQGVTHTPFPVATELLELPSPPPPPPPPAPRLFSTSLAGEGHPAQPPPEPRAGGPPAAAAGGPPPPPPPRPRPRGCPGPPPPPPMPRSSAALVQAWQGRSTELSTTLSPGRGAGGGGLERPPEKSRQVPALSPPECSFKAILDPKMPP